MIKFWIKLDTEWIYPKMPGNVWQINMYYLCRKPNKMKTYKFTAQVIKDDEVGQYIGIVPGLPGAHTQGTTLDELNTNLKEVVALCLEELTDEEINNLPDFVGIQQISVAV